MDYLAVLACCLVVLAVEARMYMRSLGGIPLGGPVPPGYELYDEAVWVQKIAGVYRPRSGQVDFAAGGIVPLAASGKVDQREGEGDEAK